MGQWKPASKVQPRLRAGFSLPTQALLGGLFLLVYCVEHIFLWPALINFERFHWPLISVRNTSRNILNGWQSAQVSDILQPLEARPGETLHVCPRQFYVKTRDVPKIEVRMWQFSKLWTTKICYDYCSRGEIMGFNLNKCCNSSELNNVYNLYLTKGCHPFKKH